MSLPRIFPVFMKFQISKRPLIAQFALLAPIFTASLASAQVSDVANDGPCNCPASPKTVKESFQHAGVVFVGTIEKFGKSALRPGMNEAVVRVMSRHKGLDELKGNTLYLYTPESQEKCGMNLIVSQDYLFYADGNLARPVVTTCSRTDVLDNALGQLEEIQRASTRPAK